MPADTGGFSRLPYWSLCASPTFGTRVQGPTGFEKPLMAYGNRSVPLCPTAALAIGPPANDTTTIAANRQAAVSESRSRRKRSQVSRQGPRGSCAAGIALGRASSTATRPTSTRPPSSPIRRLDAPGREWFDRGGSRPAGPGSRGWRRSPRSSRLDDHPGRVGRERERQAELQIRGRIGVHRPRSQSTASGGTGSQAAPRDGPVRGAARTGPSRFERLEAIRALAESLPEHLVRSSARVAAVRRPGCWRSTPGSRGSRST